jgi:hypothetical protein
MAKAHRPAANNLFSRNARLGAYRSIVMTFGINQLWRAVGVWGK